MELLELIKSKADELKDVGDLGIVETVAAKIKELGYEVIAHNPKEPEYVPKSRLDEVIAQRNEQKGQLAEMNAQMESFKKAAGGNDDLTKKINELQEKLTQSNEAIKQISVDAGIKVEALKAKARDAQDIIQFIDRGKIEVGEDGTIRGLAEQIGDLQSKKPYLFEGQKTEVPPQIDQSTTGRVDYKNLEEMSMDEYAKAFKEGKI